jgi:hypothetical protein
MFQRNRRGYEHFESKLSAALPSFSGLAGTGFADLSRQNQADQLETESPASASPKRAGRKVCRHDNLDARRRGQSSKGSPGANVVACSGSGRSSPSSPPWSAWRPPPLSSGDWPSPGLLSGSRWASTSSRLWAPLSAPTRPNAMKGVSMRKRIIEHGPQGTPSGERREWLDLESLIQIEVTSEDATHPIESALVHADAQGWRADGPGEQTIRLLFDEPAQLRGVRLVFREELQDRTQEFVLRWSADGGLT